MEESGTTLARAGAGEPGSSGTGGSYESAPIGAGGRISSLLDGAFVVPPVGATAGGSAGYAVCRVCRGPARKGLTCCWSCRRVRAQLGGGRVVQVLPLFLFSVGSAAHRTLVGYKAAPTSAGRDARRVCLETALTAFLAHHMRCVVGDHCPSALVIPVPSTTGGRPSWLGRHPVGRLGEAAVARRRPSGAAAAVDLRLAEALRPSRLPPRRLEARADGFEVRPGSAEAVGGATVIVLDDVFTSGARALSAAMALQRAGADVAAVVPIGRLVRPDHNAATAAFSNDWSHLPWRPATCAACRRPGVVPTCATAPAAAIARLAA